jgi:cysteine-rich repeat protein
MDVSIGDLGSFGVGDTITASGMAIPDGAAAVGTITFTANVLLDGTVTAMPNTADIDISLRDADDLTVVSGTSVDPGVETLTMEGPVPAGTYTIRFPAYDAIDSWATDIDVLQGPVCGNGTVEIGEDCDDGDTTDDNGCTAACDVGFLYTCDEQMPSVCTEDPVTELNNVSIGSTIDYMDANTIATGTNLYWRFNLTEAASLTGTLASTTTGDPDLTIYTLDGEFVSSSTAGGTTEDVDIALDAGGYVMRVRAFSELDGLTVDLEFAAGGMTDGGT